MKKLFFSIAMLSILALTSCQKEKDNRDQYIGTYKYDYIATGFDDYGPYNDSGVGTLKIDKLGDDNKLLFTLLDEKTNFEGFVSGSNIEIPTFTQDDGSGYIYKYGGFGGFGNNRLEITLTFELISEPGSYDSGTIKITGFKQ